MAHRRSARPSWTSRSPRTQTGAKIRHLVRPLLGRRLLIDRRPALGHRNRAPRRAVVAHHDAQVPSKATPPRAELELDPSQGGRRREVDLDPGARLLRLPRSPTPCPFGRPCSCSEVLSVLGGREAGAAKVHRTIARQAVRRNAEDGEGEDQSPERPGRRNRGEASR